MQSSSCSPPFRPDAWLVLVLALAPILCVGFLRPSVSLRRARICSLITATWIPWMARPRDIRRTSFGASPGGVKDCSARQQTESALLVPPLRRSHSQPSAPPTSPHYSHLSLPP